MTGNEEFIQELIDKVDEIIESLENAEDETYYHSLENADALKEELKSLL